MTEVRRRLQGDHGITLVEVIVTMGLMVLIMTITTGSVIQALQSQRRQVERVGALNNSKIAMERVVRELRAANPLLPDPQADAVSVEVARDGVTKRTTYALALVDGSFELQVTEDAGAARLLLRPVELSPGERLFRYFDHDGDELDPTLGPINEALVRTVEVRLEVGLRESDGTIDLTTRVLLRNAEVPE